MSDTEQKVLGGTRARLAFCAKEFACLPFHGYRKGEGSNIAPLIALFPKWNVQDADGMWCAAFVYYCCMEAGFDFPYSPDECTTCSLAGCGAWEEFALGDSRIEYHERQESFVPEAGDIVLYDRVFIDREHDHIGILLEAAGDTIIAAEGNIPGSNASGIVRRRLDEHIRAFIRIPDGYSYRQKR